MTQQNDTVDPGVAYEGFASLRNHDGHPVKAVQHAYNQAVKRVTEARREAVMIRVIVHVAPQQMSFDFDDAPLSGGVCDMTPGCESCE